MLSEGHWGSVAVASCGTQGHFVVGEGGVCERGKYKPGLSHEMFTIQVGKVV